jgi:hypothetical protein
LADFILAENLRLAYDARQGAAAADVVVAPYSAVAGEVQLSPEVKQMIAEEVKQQLAEEKSAALQPSSLSQSASREVLPPALDPAHTVFVVAGNLDVATPDGDECALTPGDVINRIDDTPDSNGRVRVRVASSKQGDCALGSKPAVAVKDLEDMHNRFHEQLDAGLKHLADNHGENGLPAAPDTTTVAAQDVPTPEPDEDVDVQLQELQNEAEQAGQEVKKESPPNHTGGR